MKRLLMVDDHPIFRHGLRQALEEAGGFDEIVEAGSGAEALSALGSGNFSVAVIDIGLPDMHGLDLLGSKSDRSGEPYFFVLTMNADPTLALRALRLGASGFASKNIALGTLVLGLRLVALGELYAEGELLRSILATELNAPKNDSDFRKRLDSLTDREHSALDALLEGLNAKETAGRMGVSRRTAENYQSLVYKKLGARTPVELVRFAVQAGLIPGNR